MSGVEFEHYVTARGSEPMAGQFAGKDRRNGTARCKRDADCGNYPRNAIPRATVRSIGTRGG
jgi:hypothetical protein